MKLPHAILTKGFTATVFCTLALPLVQSAPSSWADDAPPSRAERRAAAKANDRALPQPQADTAVIEDRTVEPQPPAGVRVAPAPPVSRAQPRASVVIDQDPQRPIQVVDLRAPDVGIWFDPTATDSLVIAAIAETGPIAQLGFKEGDRILEVNHVKVNRETDFIKLLFATKARDGRVEVLVVRKNKEMVIPVEPALLLDYVAVVRHDPLEQLGLVIDDRYDDRVVVWKVLPRSPAFYAGFRPGDVITRFGDRPIAQRQAFGEVIQTLRPGVVAVEINRAQRARPIRIEVPKDWSVDQTERSYPVNANAPAARRDVRVDGPTDSNEQQTGGRAKAESAPPRPRTPPAPPAPPVEQPRERQ